MSNSSLMLNATFILLAVAAYAAFYLGAPGRQSKAVGPPRALLLIGVVLTVAALAVSIAATQSAVGPVLVLTAMMATGTALAIAGPFVLPEAKPSGERASMPRTKRPRAAGVPPGSAGLPPAKASPAPPMLPPTRPPS